MTRVLLVEDNHEVAESMVKHLRMLGYECVHVVTVGDARDAYDPGWYDAIVLDYELPDGTGLDFLADVDREETPVALFSGLDRTRELAAAGLTVDRQFSKGDPCGLLDWLAEVAA